MFKITALVVLFENQIYSWKVTQSDINAYQLGNKYFLPYDSSDPKIKVEKKSFTAKSNTKKVWKQAEDWMRQWEIHPKLIERGLNLPYSKDE